MSRQDLTREAKIAKRQSLEADGVNVHPYSYNKTHMIEQARSAMGERITTAGRIMNKREHGKVCFLQLQDHSGQIQVMVKEDGIGSAKYRQLIELIDPSDFLGVTGTVVTTKTGEVTIEAESIEILSKALRTVPSSFQGIDDKEVRFRKRYLDLLIDPAVKKVIDSRFLIEKEIRRYLQDIHSFVEVETPVLQPLYGGTNAKPFTTHMNALDSDFFLRIAPELYLKRLIVGGYERVFEIARNFRNEGIDQTHQPEFTMIEWYHAYADYTVMMDVAEGMIKHLAEKVNGNLGLTVGSIDIDLSGNWPRLRMVDAIHRHLAIDIGHWTDSDFQKFLQEKSLEITSSYSRGKAIFTIFDKLVTPFLINPTWIIDYPKEVSPLAKQHRLTAGFVERYELYVGTKEMADGWSEVTDALEQRARFENEQKNMREGDSEAQPLDEDFLEAMEYGMPPLGGIGIGIDRLVMFLTNTWSIKEVIAFPTLRPTEEQVRMTEIMLGKKKATVHSAQATEKISSVTWKMSSSYKVDAKLSSDFPGIFYAYTIIRGIKNGKSLESLEIAKKNILSNRAASTVDEIGELTSIKAYRELFKATGTDWHSKRPSPEALLRRLAQGKNLYTINAAVDAYNLAVIESGIGLGGFDLATIDEPVTLRYSQAGEQMHLLGDDEPTTLRDGQIVYSDKTKLLTMDLNYRDIDDTKITESTTDIILFADGAPGLSIEDVMHALKKGADNIAQYTHGSVEDLYLVSADHEAKTSTLSTSREKSIGISRETSITLLESLVKNPGLRGHMFAVEAAMGGLWEYFSKEHPDAVTETKESWELVGLLHDADWEKTESTPDQHTLYLTQELAKLKVEDSWCDSIRSHNFEHLEGQRQPETLMEWSLYACDHMTGIIVACALVSPEKKLATVPIERVMKKFKEKSFAKGATRDEILMGIEHLGISLETLAQVVLSAMQVKASSIGL